MFVVHSVQVILVFFGGPVFTRAELLRRRHSARIWSCMEGDRAEEACTMWSATSVLDSVSPLDAFHVRPILAEEECAAIVRKAEQFAWRQRGDYRGHITTDLDVLPWLGEQLSPRFIPQLTSLYNASDAYLASLRIVKYVGGSSTAGLPLHSDGTPLSFVCALNSCTGAGTYVRVLRRVIAPACGHALLFCGRWLHAGVPVGEGAVRFVLTGFVAASFAPQTESALAHLAAHELGASIARRLCPTRRWLRREYAQTVIHGVGARRACTACGSHVPSHAVRHCCPQPGCCGARLCDSCLDASAAASAAVDEDEAIDAAAHEPVSYCELIADPSHAENTHVEPGAVLLKTWKLSMACRDGFAPWALDDPQRQPRLVRCDNDADEDIGSRCLGNAALTLLPVATQDDGEIYVRAMVELTAPPHAGAYRVFFRLVVGEAALPMGGTDELAVTFSVIGRSEWRMGGRR